MAYLRNTWYMAAWSYEVADNLLQRKLLDEAVLLYRGDNGDLIAVSNMCPHRFAPLHLGQIVDGAIECPYHGLRFNSEGRCVFNPDGDGRLPAGARLKTFPITERWGCAWIWMGDVEKADPALIPTFEFLDDPEHYRPVTGLLNVRANYRYITDNLMDHAHLLTVHHDTLSSDIMTRAKTIMVREPDGAIWSNRFGANGMPSKIFDMMWHMARGDYKGTMDSWAECRWNAPSLVINYVGVTLHGHPREDGIETRNSHFLTPETETTTHYFWSTTRDFSLDNPTLDEEIRKGTEYAFIHEDEVMLHALQEAMAGREFWSMKPALLQADVSAVEVRRNLDRMIAVEQTATEQASAA